MREYLYIALTLLFTLYGQLMIKARALAFARPGSERKLDYLLAMYTDIGVLSALAAAVLASVCWALALQKGALSFTYPFMVLSFVLTPVAAILLFGETASVLQVLGWGLILAGVTLSAVGA